jgi:hypothetical protein
MSVVHQIREKSERKYLSILASLLKGEKVFPLSIPVSKIVPSEDQNVHTARKEKNEELKKYSKENTGLGYVVVFKTLRDRDVGTRIEAEKIIFETSEDYFHFLGLQKISEKFFNNAQKISESFPELLEWVYSNIAKIIDYSEWTDLLKVLKYFKNNPKPNLFLRELPIEVDTKFIEKNTRLLDQLLSIILKDNLEFSSNSFSEKYNLKSKISMIRFRTNDSEICKLGSISIYDMVIPIEDFCALSLEIDTIFILENEINYLTFPMQGKSICIWGKGISIGQLKKCAWLSKKKIIYFGDLDLYGLEILSNFRASFRHVQSILMNKEIFLRYEKYAVNDNDNKLHKLPLYLTEEEQSLFEFLNSRQIANRLEQERIPQKEILNVLKYVQQNDLLGD